MQDFEKLGVFYLGKPVEFATKQEVDQPLLYESKDLVTHAVCVGMTGSGKTGLCIGLLEEAAIDAIPAIAIDPKGDIANLLLTFPELRPQDFRPWVSEAEARTKGLNVDEFAAQQADLWRRGIASFGQDGTRIERLKNAADVTIYTPGSEAGVSISILKSFAAPEGSILNDPEMLRDLISATVTSLLGLVGIEADPIQSREHVLLANIFEANWKQERDLDLPSIITQIQKPPIAKAGVMDLETFYPAKDRFALAMSFNNLLASPGFKAWLTGDPLDVASMLHTPQGKPRISILSIAHLSDSERMFFVSLLLNQVLSWVRTQPGTSSLRAVLYMDEIFGYFPPVANPPSKKALLTLLKQARAYGLGIVLATQNPVDLDYKGLSNTGTWFIGRLQTERDKMRVMDGLEGAASEAHAAFDRRAMEQLIAGLGSRTFLLNNVHEDRPQLFKTRWTLSYLSGPITREQIKRLMQNRKGAAAQVPNVSGAKLQPGDSAAPVLPPDVPQYFLPVDKASAAIYRPVLVGAAKLHFVDEKRNLNQTKEAIWSTPIQEGPVVADWAKAEETELAINELEKNAEPEITFASLPAEATKARNYGAWTKA
ncbi:MAG: ATP-binding protein, partial [Acidobacteriaceae bacterium]|nr:ATP-binding protein [Acidobacteriaceae bacterium]